MPIINQTVVEGPDVQSDGEHRGIVEFEFDTGTVVRRNVRAVDATEWAERLIDLAPLIQTEQEQIDARDGAGPDVEVTANKEASIEQRALAYLRAAWETEESYAAYLLFDKFNDYRLAKGWSLNQVQTGLASVGLTVEDWDDMKAAYTYLSGGGRPATMADALTIQGVWEAR